MTSIVHNILAALVQEWGFEHVSRCLDEAQESDLAALIRNKDPAKKVSRYEKPSAADLVSKLDVDEPKKLLLSEIAKRFDEKSFLPRLGDVRHFLEMTVKMPKSPKQRPDAFRAILKVLQEMPTEGVERVLKDRSNSGPARLGPLSRAISQAGAARNGRPPNNLNEKEGSETAEKNQTLTHPSSTPR